MDILHRFPTVTLSQYQIELQRSEMLKRQMFMIA